MAAYQRKLRKKKNRLTKLSVAISFVISSMDWIVDRLHVLEWLHPGGNLTLGREDFQRCFCIRKDDLVASGC